MASAAEIRGTVFRKGSAVLLARVVGADGNLLAPLDLASAEYTIYALDQGDPEAETPISGHAAVAVPIAALISPTLKTDALWEVDTTGYNFRHELDVSADPAFPEAVRHYRIVFELHPYQGQVILVRFRVYAI
ncbi:MAG: hypothetical protein PHN77_11075 [Thermoguttaceae bacterium]|jgi:hypothetical protein|nr:hypothetical protein [Thermoguttaceae bacterium]